VARSAAHVLIAAGSGCRTRQERSYILALQDDEQGQQHDEQQQESENLDSHGERER
jgi:hypothetical protein